MKPIWAIIRPDGRVMADSDFKDEAHAWRVALGWPDDKEIAFAKRNGYRAERVEVRVCDSNPVDVNETLKVSDKLIAQVLPLPEQPSVTITTTDSRGTDDELVTALTGAQLDKLFLEEDVLGLEASLQDARRELIEQYHVAERLQSEVDRLREERRKPVEEMD
jgi:hypothetical protein